MKRLMSKLLNLCPQAYYTLQAGLSASALSLWFGCVLLLKAGPLRIANVRVYFLAGQLQTTSIGILAVTVILACMLEERYGT